MTELSRLSTTTYKPQKTQKTSNEIKYSVQWTLKVWTTILYIFVHQKAKILYTQYEVVLESSTTCGSFPVTTNSIINWILKKRLQCGTSYPTEDMTLGRLHVFNVHKSFEVMKGRSSLYKVNEFFLSISMVTNWLRNDAIKVNLKHWMWQMWHFLTL